MRTVNVDLPITGVLNVEIEVDDNATNEDIIDKAWESATLKDLCEWEIHEKIVEGNVFHGLINDIEIF